MTATPKRTNAVTNTAANVMCSGYLADPVATDDPGRVVFRVIPSMIEDSRWILAVASVKESMVVEIMPP